MCPGHTIPSFPYGMKHVGTEWCFVSWGFWSLCAQKLLSVPNSVQRNSEHQYWQMVTLRFRTGHVWNLCLEELILAYVLKILNFNYIVKMRISLPLSYFCIMLCFLGLQKRRCVHVEWELTWFKNAIIYLFLFWGTHLVIFRAYLCFCTQSSFLVVFMGLCGVLVIKTRLVTYKTSTLPAILSLMPFEAF